MRRDDPEYRKQFCPHGVNWALRCPECESERLGFGQEEIGHWSGGRGKRIKLIRERVNWKRKPRNKDFFEIYKAKFSKTGALKKKPWRWFHMVYGSPAHIERMSEDEIWRMTLSYVFSIEFLRARAYNIVYPTTNVVQFYIPRRYQPMARKIVSGLRKSLYSRMYPGKKRTKR